MFQHPQNIWIKITNNVSVVSLQLFSVIGIFLVFFSETHTYLVIHGCLVSSIKVVQTVDTFKQELT